MKKIFLSLLVMSLASLPAFAQTGQDTALLGMAGDNLDLYAVLTLFQKSKTIEAFEKSLNDEKTKINNLDLDNNKKIDFIKVVTQKKDDSYTFVLQVDVTKTETQDVRILVDKNKDKKISMQIVGAEALYGPDYVIEPKGNSAITPNPGYTGENPVTVTVPAPTTTTVVVQSAPIVEYIYSPAYIPYYPPFYYGFYPPYFAMGACIAVGIYRANNWGYHGGYYGGHYGGGNTVVINNGNRNQINHNTSNTVANNRSQGTYGDNRAANRGNGASASTRDVNNRGGSNSNRGNGASASTRDVNNRGGSNSNFGNGGASASTRDANRGGSNSNFGGGSSSRDANRGSSSYGGSSRNMSSGSYGGGGSRGGGGGGGMSRGGGGGGGRRR